MVLPSVFHRGSVLLHLLDRRDHFRHRNPSVGGDGNQGSGPAGPAPVLHLGSTRDVPIL